MSAPRIVRTRAALARYLRDRAPDGTIPDSRDHGLALAVPRAYLDLIDWADPNDPLWRQVMPDHREGTILPEELVDPIGDGTHSPVRGIVHRYRDRALMLPTATCAVHCRFCFRREFVGRPEGNLRPDDLDAAFAYLAAHPEIWEVILSGGDVLVLGAARLGEILTRLRAISSVRVIRVHSRVPAVDPCLVTEAIAARLRAAAPLVVVVHVNHPREVSAEFTGAVSRLIDRGIPVLSQTVLLRGVNDDVTVLDALCRRLVETRVIPYQLHHPDLARGTSHFRLSIARGRRIVRELRRGLSGIANPTYVVDLPGGSGKVPADGSHVLPTGSGYAVVREYTRGRSARSRASEGGGRRSGAHRTDIKLSGEPASPTLT